MKKFKFQPWMGLLGFLGFLGFLPDLQGTPQYLFCIFFSFFGFYFWAKLDQVQADERLIFNQMRALRVVAGCFAILSFLILFLLDKSRIRRETVLLLGTLGYSAVSVLAPALILFFDQVVD